MSKNQLIKLVRNFTGLSFKESRKICKAAKWNEEIIISAVIEQYFEKFGLVVESFKPVLTELMEIIAEMATSAAEMANSLIETIKSDPEIAAALLNSENPPAFAPYDAPTDSIDKLPETTQDVAETQQGGK